MGDFVITDVNNAVPVLFSLIPTDSNGVYELVYNQTLNGGDFSIDLNGVIVQADIMYESTGAVTFSI